jgi:hypothetical protein
MLQHEPYWAEASRKEIVHSNGRLMERGSYCSFSIGHVLSKVAFEAKKFHESRVLNHHARNGRERKFVCSSTLLSVPAGNLCSGGRLVYQTASARLDGGKQIFDNIQSIPEHAQLYFNSEAVSTT